MNTIDHTLEEIETATRRALGECDALMRRREMREQLALLRIHVEDAYKAAQRGRREVRATHLAGGD